MGQARHKPQAHGRAKVVDFDEALLAAAPSELREDLMAEAALLADAFAPEGRGEELRAMAATLSLGARDEEMDRSHARRLAAALRILARRLED